LILGFKKCYQIKGLGFALILFYLASVLSVSIISMQSRHGLIFVIFHPIICQLGFNLISEESINKSKFILYRQMVIMMLLFWNLSKWII